MLTSSPSSAEIAIRKSSGGAASVATMSSGAMAAPAAMRIRRNLPDASRDDSRWRMIFSENRDPLFGIVLKAIRWHGRGGERTRLRGAVLLGHGHRPGT